MKKLKISVTQEDIDRGKRANCLCCPIALAGQRVCGPGVRMGITTLQIPKRVPDVDVDYVLKVPSSASTFAERFDFFGSQGVQPFEFEIEVPDEVQCDTSVPTQQ